MKANGTAISKENLERQKQDVMRPLRVAKYLEYPFVLPDSPVELEDGYIVADKDTGEVFASFVFKNVSDIPITKLTVRLDCYLNQNIPYRKIEFTYSQDELTFGVISKRGKNLKLRDCNKRDSVSSGETFGYCVFIPLPESYFTKMEVILCSVEYRNGNSETLDILVAGDNKHFSELDDVSRLVYLRVNTDKSAEKRHPSKVVPQFGNKVWLCCCGNKNPQSREKCELCGREKEWQRSTTAEALEEAKRKMSSDKTAYKYHDKSKFTQNKYMETEAEKQRKMEQYEQAMKNIELAEKRRERLAVRFVPAMIRSAAAIVVIWFVIQLIIGLIRGSQFQFINDIISMFT